MLPSLQSSAWVEMRSKVSISVVMDFGSFYFAEVAKTFCAPPSIAGFRSRFPGLAKLHRHLGALANLQLVSAQLRLIIIAGIAMDEQALEKVRTT